MKADEERMLIMFEKVHGKLTGACSAEILYNDDMEAYGVACMKHGYLAWRVTREELVFDYLTKGF